MVKCSPKLGQPALEFSGVMAHGGAGADEPFNSEAKRLKALEDEIKTVSSCPQWTAWL